MVETPAGREAEGGMDMGTVRVLIADDHPLVVGGLREAVLGAAPGAEIAYVEWAISNRARFAHAVVAGHEHMDAFTEIFGSRWPAIHGAASLAAEGLISIEQALASVSP